MLWSISRHGGMKRVPRRRNKNGATATYRFRLLMEIPVQKEACGCAEHARDGGVIPTSGFPRDGGTAKEGHRKDDSITEQTMHLIQHMH